MVKNPPAMQEMWVPSLSLEGPLEKGMATHSRILAWRIPRTEALDRLQSMGSESRDIIEHSCTHKVYLLSISHKAKTVSSVQFSCSVGSDPL